MWPLVCEKLDEFIDQGITVPVEEPTDWVSSLPTLGRQMGNYEFVWTQGILIQLLDMFTTKPLQWKRLPMNWAGSTCFTMLDGTSSYLCIVLDYQSSLLITFDTPCRRFRFVHLPLGLAWAQDIFQWMMDQILTCCHGVIGITDDVVVHGKDDICLQQIHDHCLWTWTCLQQG